MYAQKAIATHTICAFGVVAVQKKSESAVQLSKGLRL